MDNQHKKIKTYRELTQQEIDSMNKLKRAEAVFLAAIEEVKTVRNIQQGSLIHRKESGLTTDQIDDSLENLAVARVKVKEASMWAVRSVALPDEPTID